MVTTDVINFFVGNAAQQTRPNPDTFNATEIDCFETEVMFGWCNSGYFGAARYSKFIVKNDETSL